MKNSIVPRRPLLEYASSVWNGLVQLILNNRLKKNKVHRFINHPTEIKKSMNVFVVIHLKIELYLVKLLKKHEIVNGINV